MEQDYLLNDAPFAQFTRRTFLGVLLSAIIVGIVTFILTLAVDKVVLQPAICRAGELATCSQSTIISYHIAAVISGIVGVVMLVQASVYRPLLVMLATVLSLWNVFGAFLFNAPWPLQLLSLVTLNIMAVFTFAWILRIYNFTIALVASFAVALLTLAVSSV